MSSTLPNAGVVTQKRMMYDDVAWDRSDNLFTAWKDKLFEQDSLQEIAELIIKWRKGAGEELFDPKMGAFNVILRMKFLDGGSAIIRFPVPGKILFPEEKVRREVSVMRFIERHTSILLPHVLHYGMTAEGPAGLGPFIIMEYIENDSDLIDALNTPGIPLKDRPILDPQAPEQRLRSSYGQMADILLQLAKHSFAEIGCITNNEDDEFDDVWTTTHRPLTYNMNELVQLGNFPPHLLPQHPFKTASSFYLALAEIHMTHLSTQHNDAIDSAEDCRQKYIARCLFRKLARENRLCRFNNGPFKLYCDDFRPANVLANSKSNFSVVGAIDWEFSYAAPAEFVYSPPWWLLLEVPEYWPEGLDDWTRVYEQRLDTFLQVLKEKEQAAIKRGILTVDQCLSEHMRESWEKGDFWVNYAARKSWAFDMIYWAKIDRRFFGEGDLNDRLKLLTPEERDGIEEFVQRKLAEKEERTLTDWGAAEVTNGKETEGKK